jgi:hypothetical protein
MCRRWFCASLFTSALLLWAATETEGVRQCGFNVPNDAKSVLAGSPDSEAGFDVATGDCTFLAKKKKTKEERKEQLG